MPKNYLHSLSSYLKYVSKSKTKFAIHSPFVFDYITKVLEVKEKNEALDQIHARYKELLNSSRVVETTDFGAPKGRKIYTVRFSSVSQLARKSSVPRRYGEMLYRTVEWFKPAAILEMGTCLGISSLYMAKAAPQAKFYTLEGCAAKSELARTNFEKLGMDQIEISTGRFCDTLPVVLGKMPSPDFVFIDGHHQYKPTLSYFDQILKYANEGTVLVIDDIHWSGGMEKAWNEICQRADVSVTIDLYRLGLVFLRKGLSKQNFIIKY